MNIFLYIIIFIMGTVFGSFYTLAVYRIPKKIDITHTHSFCPNCNHKLGFWELIPVWSYIFLGGKCKNCGKKIRPRYLIIEVMSGFTFVLFALATKVSVETLEQSLLIGFLFMVLYITAIFIIAGIDLERREIEKSVLYYALGILVLYIIYLCIVDKTNICRYVMYLAITLILLIIDTIRLKKTAKSCYLMSLLILLMFMAVFTGEIVTYLTIIMTLLIIAFYVLAKKIKQSRNKVKRDDKEIASNLNFGFYLGVSNIIITIFALFIANY